ncbi:MAG: hypothetical protein ACPHW2_06250 [Candidatus Micropelagos thuwalensis]
MQIDFKEFLEIIFIEFDKNPTTWISIGCSIFVIFLFLLFRLMFSRKSNKEIRKNHPAILNNTQGVTENSQDLPSFITNENKSNKEFNLTIDDTLEYSVESKNNIMFEDDNDLVEELLIPRPGMDEDKPRKSLFEKSNISAEKKLPDNNHTQTTRNKIDNLKFNISDEELIELEKKLSALQELHDAGLIATEIYILKSREFARGITEEH